MNVHRAKMIAENFSPNAVFNVMPYSRGLLVRYNRGTSYFIHESGFWPFIYKLASIANQEDGVAEIESRLAD